MVSAALQDAFGLTGTVLEGQYRVEHVVGEGGFGVVYRGHHLSLDQPVAIKVLKGLDGGDPKINALVLDKFRDEARLLYTLSQSSLNIVRALHFSAVTTPSGSWAPFMVLEWLDGESLAEDLERRAQQRIGGRPVQEAMPILNGIAEALMTAHRQQVAHRDIKPANVFLLRAGEPEGPRVKMLDFGIAKMLKDGEAAGTKGTLASFTWLYAAPEQLDPRLGLTGLATDVYAFGLLITELLTGRAPIDATDVVGIMHTAMDTARRPTPRTLGANIPDELEAICRKALSVNPGDRYPSITEMWGALTAASRTRSATTMQHAIPQPPGGINPLAATNMAPPGSAPVISGNSGVNALAATNMASSQQRPSMPGNPSPVRPSMPGNPSPVRPSMPGNPSTGRPSMPSAARWTPPPPTPPGYAYGPAPPAPQQQQQQQQQQWGPPPMAMMPQQPQWVQRLPIRPPETMSTTAIVTIVAFVVLIFFSASCAMCGACLQAM